MSAILRENDNIVTDPSSVSELFNDYLSGVAFDIGFDDPRFNPHKVTRYDHIPAKITRIAYQELSSPFTGFINIAISASAFHSVLTLR